MHMNVGVHSGPSAQWKRLVCGRAASRQMCQGHFPIVVATREPSSPERPNDAAVYLCMSGGGATPADGGASEIANVSQVFQPSGRSLAANSKYDFKPRKPCLPAIGKIYPA